ncbi:amino acid permease [Atlantibacter subterranea]|uniref:APC family permease n=1 Tax=Atlantibacter subterraneus TaxID=255519 RepID=UPI00118298EF|nr:APC family permease [Atlantibacter subterranea]TSJ59523.1 amino acid permease [Atlantibacter subterranea]
MNQPTSSEHGQLKKVITFKGFLGMGIGCVFGASWLVLTGVWLDTAGGPLNVVIAIILCLVIELPLALAYLEAISTVPLAGGEAAYAYLAFGSFAAMIAGWFGVLVNIILCAWEAIAITTMVGYLIPTLKTMMPLYAVGGSTVTGPFLLLGLILVFGIGLMQHRGVKMSSALQTGITVTVLTLVIISLAVCVAHSDVNNLKPLQTRPTVEGVVALLALLPFSIAGWETIAKGAEEASATLSRQRTALALIVSVVFATFMYLITVLVPAAIVPWQSLLNTDIPFANASREVTGTVAWGYCLTAAACCGVVGVYNACFYGATRLLMYLSQVGLIPAAFSRLHPVYKTPTTAILFVSSIAAAACFLGKAVFIPLVTVAAFSYIVLWGSTLFSVIRLRKIRPNLPRPLPVPGGKVVMCLGVIMTLLMACAMLVPGSPAALKWPYEYLLLGFFLIIGIALYLCRDRSLSDNEQARRILENISEI